MTVPALAVYSQVMGRDLLYKPPVPIVLPEDKDEGKERVTSRDKLGLPVRGRDLGGETPPAAPTAKSSEAPKPPSNKSSIEAPARGAPPSTSRGASKTKGPAFKAAYFNRDVEATTQVNQRSRPMQALRGQEGATDLKKVVLPPGSQDSPDPAQLRSAGDLMGLGGMPDLETLLQRQGTWARAPKITVEMMQARLAELELMVEARAMALARLARLPRDRIGRSVTLSHAAQAQGKATENSDDLVAEGDALARGTARQARGMHRRIAKTLGVRLDESDDDDEG